MQNALTGKRVLVTQASEFMGPAFCEVFAEQGAEVIRSNVPLAAADAAEEVVAKAGPIDVLVANLSVVAPSTPAPDVGDEEWRTVFAALVDPLPRLTKAVVPQFLQRGRGKILVIGSASALRGMKRASTYSAARGAQLAYVQAVGVGWPRRTFRSTSSRRTLSTTQPTSLRKSRRIQGFKSGLLGKFLSAA